MLSWDIRTRSLLGDDALEKLHQSRVAVIGLGGVGAYAAEALVRCGVGSLLLVDPDQVEISNLNRQLAALHSTLGQYKVDILQKRFLDIAPGAKIEALPAAYNAESSEYILGERLDYLVDAIDSLSDKLHLMKSCLKQNIPFISAMGAAKRLDPTAFKVADISETNICPMARRIRRQLRQEGIYKGVKVVYSTEPPCPTYGDAEDALGSISFVPPAAGLVLASAVVKDLLAVRED